ncbi:MAG: sensor histidine kinase, partial [Chloroflexi bacterium]
RRQAEEALREAKDADMRNQAHIEVQRRLIEQREQERQQIARDLHDGPVQVLTAASFNLQSLTVNVQNPQMAGELNTLRDALQEAIHELRTYAQELRPPILFNFGLRRAIEAHLEGFHEKHPDLRIHAEVRWTGQVLSEQIAIALFRIFQEGLNNVIKHAQASEVWVSLARDDRQISLEIADNGTGFTAPRDLLALARQGHLGLVGISERVEAIGGCLEIDAHSSGGARIRVTVPLADGQ